MFSQCSEKAVEILNADFQAKNSDIVQWNNNASKHYPNISKGAACIEFRLGSKNHPAGYDLQDGDLAVTINKTSSDSDSKWSGYINIFVGDADGNLGYAPLGGSGQGDGMVINSSAFTIGTSCGNVTGNSPNDLGRTLTHEMGHYLNLDHVWGDGGCSADDGVSDTPNQEGPNYGCPTLGQTKACSEEALHMNYMDYPDDACMYMFTSGQASRVEAWVNSGLLNNLKKAADVFGDTDGGSTGGGDTDGGDTGGGNTGGGDTDGGSTGGGDTDGGDTDGGDTDGGDTDGGDTDEGGTDGEDTDEGDVATTSDIKIEVTLDDYGSETTFAIEDMYGDIIASYGPFADGEEGKIITEALSLDNGIYTFVILDEYGDGICCDVGNGKWKIYKDAALLASSDGNFGYWEQYDFAVGAARLSGPASRKDKKNPVQLKQKIQKPAFNIATR